METKEKPWLSLPLPKCPYLLGKSIEWKHPCLKLLIPNTSGPYLLGKSIEWKRDRSPLSYTTYRVPTY